MESITRKPGSGPKEGIKISHVPAVSSSPYKYPPSVASDICCKKPPRTISWPFPAICCSQ